MTFKTQPYFSLFLLTAGMYFLAEGEILPFEWVWVLKPLPALVLAAWLAPKAGSGVVKWAMIGLIFSAIGDVLLIDKDRFFLLGMAAFALAHIAYIIAFWREVKRKNGLVYIPFFIWAATLVGFLWNNLGEFKGPIVGYGFLLSSMMWLATLRKGEQLSKPSKWGFLGALSFGISDSLLAFNLFGSGFPMGGTIIMLTYWLGQWGIASGFGGKT